MFYKNMNSHFSFLLCVLVCLMAFACSDTKRNDRTTKKDKIEHQIPPPSVAEGTTKSDNDSAPDGVSSAKIPKKVLKALQYVKDHNEAPDGYVGGRVFQNRERHLPIKDAQGRKIKYQEWM
jgi:hypothetical protein